jgi:hypothetical protein
MTWTPQQRLQFLENLASTRRVLTSVYRAMIVAVIVGVLAISLWVYLWRPLGAGHQGEYLYFTVGALFGLGWAINELFRTRRRRCGRVLPNVEFRSTGVDGGNVWEFRLGPASGRAVPPSSTRFEFTSSFSPPLVPTPSHGQPGDVQAENVQETDGTPFAFGSDWHLSDMAEQPAGQGATE